MFLLYLPIVLQIMFDAEELKLIQSLPPYDLEHVELELRPRNKLSIDVAVVDAVLWCCRP